ncbi:ribonuclease D, partial [Saccharopolyspora kobensis]
SAISDSAARAALSEIAEANQLPVENLLLPDLVRRTCWSPPEDRSLAAVTALLREKGAREWQLELTAAAIAEALKATAPAPE